MKRKLAAAVMLAAVSLGGCGGRQPLRTNAGLVVTSAAELPEPTRADIGSSVRPGVIGPYDKLSVLVAGLEDLSVEEVQVDPTGQISLPVAGAIDAAGHTSAELSLEIRNRLRAGYIRDPQVAVNIREMVSHTFTVDGEVTEPGVYPAIGDLTLMKAIATAKGATEFSKLDDVVVFRTVNNQRMAALYNISAIRRGLYGDPRIFANDTIVVGDSPARHLFKDFASLAPLIAGPIIALIQRN